MKRQQIRKLSLLISFLLFPVTMYYFSPAVIIMGAVKGIIAGSFIMFALMLLAALFFGRFFCGWLCPGAGLQEMCMTVTDKPASAKYNRVKYFIWVPWLGTILALFVLAGGVQSIEPLLGTTYGISIAEPSHYIVFYSFIALIVILALAIGRRGFCHSVCWMAPFMIIGSKLGNVCKTKVIRLTADKEKCVHCKLCTRNCVMSLPVENMVQNESMEHTECILCGRCIDICPKKAISFAGAGKLVKEDEKISRMQ